MHEGGKPFEYRVLDALVEVFGLRHDWLLGHYRPKRVSLARQLGYYVIRKHTTMSFPEIGAFFGGRNHQTIIHGCDRIAWQLEHDTDLLAKLDRVLLLCDVPTIACSEFVLSLIGGRPVDYLAAEHRRPHDICARPACHLPRAMHNVEPARAQLEAA